ncbi:MAG TPA: hypothetical protein PLH94_03830 [Fimbriimonadaceae bacterium]|nr:hypothetical protein [Fimbriimonadaceae bacterium]
MRFFVIANDGNEYGPADIPTLNEWATQNRLTPTTQLKNEATGEIVMASAVPGIVFPGAAPTGFTPGPAEPVQPVQPQQPYQSPQQPYQAPQQPEQPYQAPQQPQQPYQAPQGGYQQPQNPYGQAPGASPYPRANTSTGGIDDGSKEMTWAWILAVVSLCCCWLAGIGGVIFANQAKAKGHPQAQTAMIVNIAAMVISLLGGVIYVVLMGGLGGLR